MSLLEQAGAHVKTLRPSGGCHNCPRKRIDFILPDLREGIVLWVGEAPGASEVLEGAGFTGSTSQALKRAARQANVPEPWSFTYLIHCRPPDGRTPSSREIECCLSQFLLEEIRGYRIVVLMGTPALQAFFPGAKATHFRGNFAHHPDFPGQLFYAIYSPAYIVRRPDLEPVFVKQLDRLGRVARGESAQKWRIVQGKEALDAVRTMVSGPVVSLDLETTGINSWEPDERVISFCATSDGKLVAAMEEEDPYWQAALDLILAFLQDPSKTVVGSFCAFDVEMLERKSGVRAQLTGIQDVSVIWYEAGQYKYASLKQLAAEELDGYRYLVHQPHECRDVTLLLKYNAEDVVHSWELFIKGMKALNPKTRDLVSRVIGPMTLVYQRARAHGLYVREDYRQQLLHDLAEERQAAVDSWKEADPEFIPKMHESGNGLLKYLFEVRQLPVIGETKTGQPTTTKSVIKAYVRDFGANYLEHLLKIREIDKLVGTFVMPLEKHMDVNCRVHPSHWLTSTDTSRPSSSDPNVYNIPRDRRIRNLYGVPPGSLLLDSDLSQIEFRIMVSLAKDENGIAGYLRGDDAHTMTARKISGNAQPTKEERSQAKPVNFGNLYGAHWKTAQAQAVNDYGVIWSDQQAEAFQRSFFDTYPRIPQFHDSSRAKLKTNRGWFESVTGHVFHYRDWDHPDQKKRDHAFRAALNAEAQGPGANICYLIAVVARRVLDARGMMDVVMVNSVYDSIMTEIPNPKDLPAVVEIVEEASEITYEWIKSWFLVPLVMEHEIGEAWGSLEEYSIR